VPITARALTPADQPALVDFLLNHRDTSLFLLSNLERSGVVAGDEPFQGSYWGAFEGEALVGVLAHYWQGIVMPMAPQGLEQLSPLLLEQANRPIQGFIGVRDQVDWLTDSLKIKHWRMDAPEPLYALDLAQLRWPEILQHDDLVVRHATKADEDQLVDWRVHYVGEAMAEPDNAETRRRARDLIQQEISSGHLFVLCGDDEALLAMSGFNAVAAQTVQIGGVYTPTSQRAKGYGRAVVAGSLALARSEGMTRSVLFTGHDNHAAQRAYEALGYQHVGEFGMKFLDEPLLAERF